MNKKEFFRVEVSTFNLMMLAIVAGVIALGNKVINTILANVELEENTTEKD